jgi:hypothetical protein
MKQTAMQEMIFYLNGLLKIEDKLLLEFKDNKESVKNIKENWQQLNRLKEISILLLKKEKEQIINSHVKCLMIGIEKEGKTKFTDTDEKLVKQDIENYFDKTFKK